MSATFEPDDSAIPQSPWSVTLLSQRDVGIQIPVNYITAPGISVTAACFPHKVYNSNAIVTCVSNLLEVGFRRFEVDIYWDVPRRIWSLCPVQLPVVTSSTSTTSSATNAATGSANAGLNPASQTSLTSSHTASQQTIQSSSFSHSSSGFTSTSGNGLLLRQAILSTTTSPRSTTQGVSSFQSTQPSSTVATRATTTVSSVPIVSGSGSPSYQSGPYTCSIDADLSLLTSLLEDFFDKTSTNLEAVLKYFIFNMHAAASELDPTGPASQPTPSEMPSASELLGVLAQAALDGYLFQPTTLLNQRSDLNSTWYTTSNATQPDPSYYVSRENVNGTYSSPNGWPSESYLEFTDFKRIFFGTGTVDPQMLSYDFATDSQNIFTTLGGSDLSLSRPVTDLTVASSGSLSTGCIFNPSTPFLDSATNSSWSVSSYSPLLSTTKLLQLNYSTPSLEAIQNLTACGITPVLNTTLLNTTADINILPYQRFAYASIWSWAPNQPAVESSNSLFRCAALDTAQNGRWVVRDCSESHAGACRRDGLPYSWSLSSSASTYTGVNDLCDGTTTFAVPRTAMENSYLLSAALAAHSTASRNPVTNPPQLSATGADPFIWLNFNSLDVQSCWVTGTNSTCPYSNEDTDLERTIVVPTIAAVIVIVLALLTVLAKCAGNRRELKRRRKNVGGWEYEGVPN